MGWRASDTRELTFEDAVVPKENLLGELGQGFANFLKTLDAGRIGIAALSLGIAEGAYEQALAYAGLRKQFGKPIGSFQGVSFQLADMALEIEAGTHLLYHAAWLKQNGRPFKKEAAMAKLYSSEMAGEVTDMAVQIHGGYGLMEEYDVERFWRALGWADGTGGGNVDDECVFAERQGRTYLVAIHHEAGTRQETGRLILGWWHRCPGARAGA